MSPTWLSYRRALTPMNLWELPQSPWSDLRMPLLHDLTWNSVTIKLKSSLSMIFLESSLPHDLTWELPPMSLLILPPSPWAYLRAPLPMILLESSLPPWAYLRAPFLHELTWELLSFMSLLEFPSSTSLLGSFLPSWAYFKSSILPMNVLGSTLPRILLDSSDTCISQMMHVYL